MSLMLSVIYAQCHLQTLVCRYAECCYAERRSAVYLPLTANIRLGRRLMTKALAYYDVELVTAVKSCSRGLLRC
jgi:hypothetical protein